MSNNMNDLYNQVTSQENRSGAVTQELQDIRTLTTGVISSISMDYTGAKVTLEDGQTVYASIIEHPNYWNIVGHLRVGEKVQCSVQKKHFNCHIMYRIHDKGKSFPDFPCYLNKDTNPWGTYAA